MLYRKQAKSVKPLGEKKGSNSDEKPKCKRQKLPWKIDVIVTFESRKSFKITLCIYESSCFLTKDNNRPSNGHHNGQLKNYML